MATVDCLQQSRFLLVDLVVNDGLWPDTNRFTLEIVTTEESVRQLLTAISESRWPHKQSLLAILKAALASVERDDLTPALKQLEAFQNLVTAQVALSDPDWAASISGRAQTIINAFQSCDARPGQKRALLRANPSEGGSRVEFVGVANSIYIIEASSDMVNWERIGTARHTGNGQFEFHDPHASKFTRRFYRAVAP